jgi:vancomycin permeability regulator SanA
VAAAVETMDNDWAVWDVSIGKTEPSFVGTPMLEISTADWVTSRDLEMDIG